VDVAKVWEKLEEAVNGCAHSIPKLDFTAAQHGGLVAIPNALTVQDALEDEYFVPSVKLRGSERTCNLGLWTGSMHVPEAEATQLDTESIAEQMNGHSAKLDTRKRSLVKCMDSGRQCIIAHYRHADGESAWERWRTETFKLHALHELIGIYEHADSEDGPASVVHLIRANRRGARRTQTPFTAEKAQETCARLKDFVLQAFHGDMQAMEAFLMLLVARPSLRVNGLVDSLFVGKLCLNLRVPDSREVGNLFELLKLFREHVAGPLEVSNCSGAFSTAPIYPTLNVESGLLSESPLQQPEGAILLVDETALTTGELRDQAVRNLQALIDLVRHQQIPLDFAVQQVLLKVDMPVVVVSLQGRSVLPSDVSLSCARVRVPAASAEDLALFSEYLAYCRSEMQCQVDESMAAYLEQEYVRLRQERGTGFDEHELHRLLNLARLRAVVAGEETLSPTCWQETKGLFLQEKVSK